MLLEKQNGSYRPDLTGPEISAMLKIGTRVVRGLDWKWGDQVRFTSQQRLFQTSLITYQRPLLLVGWLDHF